MISARFVQAVRDIRGDAVEPFVATVEITGYYGNVPLTDGCHVRATMVANPPRVEIGGVPSELYTLIMLDPEAPNQNEPQLPDISWLVTNIPGRNSCTQGDEILSYVGPNHDLDVYQCILVLYKQQSHLVMNRLESRLHFNARVFTTMHNLGDPVAMAFFTIQR